MGGQWGGTLVPGKVTQVVRCPCMAPPVSYHTMTMHRLHVTAHNRDAATLRVSQRSPNRQSGSPWGTRLLWGSASHLEMSILRSALVSCNSWSCISGPDIVIPALNLNSYRRRHLEKKSNLWTVFDSCLWIWTALNTSPVWCHYWVIQSIFCSPAGICQTQTSFTLFLFVL